LLHGYSITVSQSIDIAKVTNYSKHLNAQCITSKTHIKIIV
jgi:hypothetical protein